VPRWLKSVKGQFPLLREIIPIGIYDVSKAVTVYRAMEADRAALRFRNEVPIEIIWIGLMNLPSQAPNLTSRIV
jgi:hypothetical protein